VPTSDGHGGTNGRENDRSKRSGKINLGTDIKAVWIASVPRCGSMWVFNVTRRLARDAGLEVLPTPVPQTDKAICGLSRRGAHLRGPPHPARSALVLVHHGVRRSEAGHHDERVRREPG
jgi:hypothetical protein